MIFDIDSIEQKIKYSFKDKMLLRKCFTHSSYSNEHGGDNNEILEFFGDAVIEFVVTEYLVDKCKGDEGVMTKVRSEIVSKEPLLFAIKKLGLEGFVLLGNGQNKNHNLEEKLYSSVYEALCAGIYYDGGMTAAKKFIKSTILNNYEERLKYINQDRAVGEAKTKLQEFVQKYKMGSITYELLSSTGPDHNPEFREAVLLNGTKLAEGKGGSKKIAQSVAAEKAYAQLLKQEGKEN